MPAKQRSEMYLSGGIMSVTSRILVVDMLSKRIPTGLITGLVVLHAEKVTPTSVEAFIARIYRQENKEGFLKAFSDNPEHFTMGISPLQTVLSQLRIRKVELWPRFHQQTSKDLGQRKADVVELHQPLSRSMRNIQTAIIECLDASLSELKRGNANVETDDFSIEHAIFRAFDVVVRRQLDPIWHKVSAKTKQLVGDLTTLRNLLNYLLTYDCVTFNSYLETILASSTTTSKGTAKSVCLALHGCGECHFPRGQEESVHLGRSASPAAGGARGPNVCRRRRSAAAGRRAPRTPAIVSCRSGASGSRAGT